MTTEKARTTEKAQAAARRIALIFGPLHSAGMIDDLAFDALLAAKKAQGRKFPEPLARHFLSTFVAEYANATAGG